MCFVVCLFLCLLTGTRLIYPYVFCCLFVSVFVYRNQTDISICILLFVCLQEPGGYKALAVVR